MDVADCYETIKELFYPLSSKTVLQFPRKWVHMAVFHFICRLITESVNLILSHDHIIMIVHHCPSNEPVDNEIDFEGALSKAELNEVHDVFHIDQ